METAQKSFFPGSSIDSVSAGRMDACIDSLRAPLFRSAWHKQRLSGEGSAKPFEV